MWKDFFYYSRNEKRGIVVLIILIIVVTGIRIIAPYLTEKESIAQDNTFEEEYATFIASLKEKEKEAQKRYIPKSKAEIVLARFNPNTADSLTFIRLGLPSWMAGNILKYRRNKGVFRQPEDFKKIYGLTEEQYNTLHPYIDIPPLVADNQTIRNYPTANSTIEIKDTVQVQKEKPFKYPEGTLIELNQADTTELKKIPGIGTYTAQRIVRYRQQLGGFRHIRQLEEIQLDAEQFKSWFSIDTGLVKPININKASVERLKAHPYFNFYQAKVIVEYRQKKGKLKNLNQFALYEEFTEEDLERIKWYVCFE